METRVPLDAIELCWSGIDHAEDVAAEPDGTVWCGGEDGQVYRGRLEGEPHEIARLPGRVYGLVLDADRNAYCCCVGDPSGVYRVSPAGKTELVSSGTRERRCVFPNQPVLVGESLLVFSDSGNWGEDDGCLYMVTRDGETYVADESCARYPNGVALGPDDRSLVVVESTLPGVVALEWSRSGELGNRRVLAELPGTVPDGVAFDERGRLLVGCWYPDAVYLVDAGRAEALVYDPQRVVLNSPTNIAFVPGTRRVVCANYGERFLSVFEHECAAAPLPTPILP